MRATVDYSIMSTSTSMVTTKTSKRMDQQFLRTIFESSGNLRRINLPQEYLLLERYLQHGLITLEANRLTPKPNGILYQLTEFVRSQPRHLWTANVHHAVLALSNIDNGGGLEHQLLCWGAAAWLIDQGYSVSTEQRFAGKQVDLITSCRSWLIECGDTLPTPIARHLLRGVAAIGVVPFQETPAANGSIQMFIFSKGEQWCSPVVQNDLVIDLNGG